MNHRNRTQEKPKEEIKPVIKKVEVKKEEPVISNEVPPEEIEPIDRKKIYDNVGLVGNTIECRDFRAILKKQGKTIHAVLPEILQKWNTENYNL